MAESRMSYSSSPDYEPDSPPPPPRKKRRGIKVLSPDDGELFGSPDASPVLPSNLPPSPSLQPPSPDPPSSPEWNIDFEAPAPPTFTLHGSIPPSIGRFLTHHSVHVHTQTLAVLSIGKGFTLTNGFVTLSTDTLDLNAMMDDILQLQLGYVVCTDAETQKQLHKLQNKFDFHPIKYVRSCVQKFRNEIGVCPHCNEVCHRYSAVMGMSMYIRFKLEPIPHSL